MPNYITQVPPYSIFPSDMAFAFNNESPAAGQSSQQFAPPSFAGFPETGRTVRWQTVFGTAPTSVNIVLQTVMSDSDAKYSTIDTSNATGGEALRETFRGARERAVRTPSA